MYTYKILEDLPKVPDEFVEHALYRLENPTEDITPNRLRPEYIVRQLHKDGQLTTSTRTFRYDMNDEFKQWVRENIVPEWTETTVSKTPASIGPHMGAHTDKSNNFRLMYVLQPGGENCRTVWYQEKGQPFYRPGRLWLNIDDFDQLIEKDYVVMPAGKWVLMSTQHLHSVENIESDRIAIHVALLEDTKILSAMHQESLVA